MNETQGISNALNGFYQSIFKEKLSLSKESIQSFLDKVSLPKLNDNQALECECFMKENELLKAIISMDNDKKPGKNGITKQFYVKFWDFLRTTLCFDITIFFGWWIKWKR